MKTPISSIRANGAGHGPSARTAVARLRPRAAAGLVVLALLALVPATASAAAPPYFVGIQGWDDPSAQTFGRLHRANVDVWRTNLVWASVERTRGRYNWSRYDSLFARSAAKGVRIFPVLIGSPPWANPNSHYPPQTPDTKLAFYNFAKAAVARYGPRGTFWRTHRAPIAVRPLYWQVWNEENLVNYWGTVDPRAYGRFLRNTSTTAKKADPSVRIVAGGLYVGGCTRGMCINDFASQMLAVPGVASAIDAMAIHPYSMSVSGVLGWLDQLNAAVRSSTGRSMPTFVTEIGWATSGRHYAVDYPTQAQLLTDTYNALLANRSKYRLRGVYWFSLKDTAKSSSWLYNTGVFDRYWNPKPSWSALVSIAGGRP